MKISTNQQLKSLTIFLILFSMVIKLVPSVDCLAVDHCYSDIGCFPLSEEFYHPRHRPINVRPWHRNRIKTQFELYNKHHPEGYILRPWNRLNLLGSNFNPLLETKIIIPGWLDNIKRALWVRRLKDSLLWLWNPANIVVVHWRNFTPYTIATANTRVVGAELANLLKSIEHELNYDRSYYHLIGHSLGAHICGYCGDRMAGLGRITALDPARPFFQHMPKSVRLDRGDARFVDAIHSDFTPENAIFLLMSFGMTTPVGHLDFYPNGPPLFQPGCLRDTLLSVQNGIVRGLQHSSLSIAFLEAIRYLTACDHQRAHEWFIESITNRQCVFVGVRCNEFEGLINGRCTCDNSPSACAIMGIHADQMYLNNVHEDLWPLKAHNRPLPESPPVQQALMSSGEENDPDYRQLGQPITKNHLYLKLKHHASQLRQPPLPTFADELPKNLDDDIKDTAFVEYLQSSILMEPPQSEPFQLPPANQFFSNSKQANFGQDDEASNDLEDFPIMNEHPKLMSDLDRDIESWYEDSSRWFLKTNNKPNYCVNQYQVLVFVGPLKTTTGHRHIRANLIISIIGSRGQLMNQRFIPRSANLDSFTMQPFFILLEGSYSLGNIISIAIGWEARIEPDPIQTTVSFKSNLLEGIQPLISTYNVKHPWLSATIDYDHSDAFKWRPPRGNEPLSSEVDINLRRNQEFGRRSSMAKLSSNSDSERGCSVNINGPTRGHPIETLPSDTTTKNSIHEFLSSGESRLHETSDYYDDEGDEQVTSDSIMRHPRFYLENNEIEKTNQFLHKPLVDDELIEQLYTTESRIAAKIHNTDMNNDGDLEDSIVVNQVIVSPLQANYGKKGVKVGKTFCPPQSNYRLRRDQTVKLVLNLVGKCYNQYFDHQPIEVG